MSDFVIDALERATKTAAQAAVLVLGADAFDLLAADWVTAASFAGGGFVSSLLTSVMSGGFGRKGTASLTGAVVSNTEHVDQLAQVAAGRTGPA